jgi:hypothetical protein
MNGNTRFWLFLVAGLVLVTVLAGGAGSDGPPLDPRSVNPDGTRGLVETLERLGADVDLDSPVPTADTTSALLIVDRLSEDDADRLEDWILNGGTLVVTDPASRFAPFRSGFASEQISAGDCTIPWLQDTSITGNGRTFDGVGIERCFGAGDEGFLTIERRGAGTIAALGGARLITNEQLSQLDNAYVMTSLLAPEPDAARIGVLSPSLVDFGEQSLNGLVATRVRNAIIMLLAAFGLYALFRMRRLGAVVREPQPVPIRGSELVLQAGVLSERAKDPASAASVIREDFSRRWRRTLAVEDNQPQRLANQIAAYVRADAGGAMSDAAEAALAASVLDGLTHPVSSDNDLVAAIARLDAVDHPANRQQPDLHEPNLDQPNSEQPNPEISTEVSPRV